MQTACWRSETLRRNTRSSKSCCEERKANMKTIELTETQSVEDLLELARKESGVVVTKSGQAVAQVIPMPARPKQRIAPLHPGAWEVREDFDEPLPDEFWLGKE